VNGYYFGVPVMIGAGGIEKVIEMELSPSERKGFELSLTRVKELVQAMDKLLAAS